VCALLGYALYLGFGIYGCLQLNEGLSLKRLVPDFSYYADFYDKLYEDFMDYPYRIPVSRAVFFFINQASVSK
jgi:hypothetical protein